MRALILAATLTLVASAAAARSYDDIMAEAQVAFEAEDYAALSNLLDEAQQERPYSLFIMRNRVLARVLNERMDEAISLVKDVADRGLVLQTPPHEAFDRLRAEPAFAPIAAQMAENAKPVGTETTALENGADDLLPEAIALTRKRETLIGSVRNGKIIAIDKSGAVREVAAAKGGVFDIELSKKELFAAVNNQLAYENSGAEPAFAAVVAYDARTGAVLRSVRAPEGEALFGDIELARNGDIYVSDSVTPRIMKLAKTADALEPFAADARFANLQGLALDEANRRLFVADYLTGLYSIDLGDGAITPLANPTGAHLGGIDGLYLYRGDLIGVQNGTSPQRIVRIALDKDAKTVDALTVVQQALPSWNEPTHGVAVGKEFRYIATTNWPAYDDAGKLRDHATLAPLRVMSVELD